MLRAITRRVLPCLTACVGWSACQAVEAGRPDVQFVVMNLHADEVEAATFARLAALDARRSHVRIGAAAIFSYLGEPRDRLEERLRRFLALAERYDVPVVVQPDGEQWLQARPDLWNWWDQTHPGYDPANRHNVEWVGWSPDDAIRIAWRNWGSQIRVLPPPNLLSPAYREACAIEMRRLLPIVVRWWRELPADRKDLLIAVKLGWESSIGVNAFYYPDGNRLLERDVAEDPSYGLDTGQLPGRGVVATGYAAAVTAGLADRGELSEALQVEIVRRHLEGLGRIASDCGVPRGRLFTHVGGWKDGELLYDAAVNAYSCPGWSCYRHARHPQQDRGIARARARSDAPYWAAVEWYPVGAVTPKDWSDAIGATLAMPGCRYLCLYNWRSVRDDAAIVAAIAASTHGETGSEARGSHP